MLADSIAFVLLVIGLIFNALGVIGLIRFPDVYTRLHASTKATTFGSIFLCLGVVVYAIALFLTSDLQFHGNCPYHNRCIRLLQQMQQGSAIVQHTRDRSLNLCC
ncbi:MAG: monovalent cation/H(+) antiporter subunit G [Burkholderiales bacterium]|nr:monovalent cation/H(+) antiporter subunit G [Burkholderiales bacterium]